MRNKYGAIKTKVNGFVFASKREAARYQELYLLLKAKKINNLILQPPFLIAVNGMKICKYIADFSYIDGQGITHVEDAKGMRTATYRLKKKLVEALYPVKIEEV